MDAPCNANLSFFIRVDEQMPIGREPRGPLKLVLARIIPSRMGSLASTSNTPLRYLSG